MALLERGDVVVFRDSQGWLVPAAQKAKGPFTWVQDGLTFVGLLPDNSEQHLVKRVIGLPGDHVVCCDAGGRLTVNGAPLDENYINPAEVPQVRDFDVVVPDGQGLGHGRQPEPLRRFARPYGHQRRLRRQSPTSKARPPSSPGR